MLRNNTHRLFSAKVPENENILAGEDFRYLKSMYSTIYNVCAVSPYITDKYFVVTDRVYKVQDRNLNKLRNITHRLFTRNDKKNNAF